MLAPSMSTWEESAEMKFGGLPPAKNDDVVESARPLSQSTRGETEHTPSKLVSVGVRSNLVMRDHNFFVG